MTDPHFPPLSPSVSAILAVAEAFSSESIFLSPSSFRVGLVG